MKILLKNDNITLYIQGKDLFMHIICRTKYNPENPMKTGILERTLQIDNKQEAISIVKELLDCNCKISKNLTIVNAKGKQVGKLQHHLIAGLNDKPLGEVRSAGVRFINERDDLRLNNLRCSLIPHQELSADNPSAETVSLILTREWDDLVIQCKRNGTKYRTDYSPEIEQVVMSPYLYWKPAARDRRLAACIAGTNLMIYLYQIRMIQHLYGLPTDREELIEVVERFRHEFIKEGFNIDHLDCDIKNNCLENLFLMTNGVNIAKQKLTARIKYPNFWHSKRDSNDLISVQAGYASKVIVEDKFKLDDYMVELRRFVGEEALTEIELEECA